MSAEREQLEAGIAALEAQRALLGDSVVDTSVAGLRARLVTLAAPSSGAPVQTRRQVSILFLEVVGSTTLTQYLDPETVSAVMDDALSRGTAIVEAHRGKVLQYAGDSILAAFGADQSREDDTERAVHCGLALVDLGKTLGAQVQAAHDHAGFNVRVGLHTGGVLLGGGVDAEGSIRGISVNIAARMEQTAPAGALRITQDTYAHVRGLFEVDAQAPLAVKGVDAPIQSYLVRGAKPRSFRIATRGIILAWRFRIADDDSVEAARKKMEDGIVPLFIHDDGPDLAEAHAHLLGHLIGIEWKGSRHVKGILDDPKQIRKRAFHAAAELFRRVSASEGLLPVVLQLEDLHWADDESLDFLNYLTEIDRDVPLLLLASTRPTLFDRRADWHASEGAHQRIDLAPLGKDMSRLLANELLKKVSQIPTSLRELVTGSAEGNPFYMEELVKVLIDQGAIQTRPDRGEAWKVDPERLLVMHVPPTCKR